MEFDELSHKVIGCAIEVHRALGPGLLESTYEQCLSRELELSSINYERQYALPLEYKGVAIEVGYRIDLFVHNSLIVELKAIENVLPVHEAQLLTYMKLAQVKVGLLINFNVKALKDGIKRFVL